MTATSNKKHYTYIKSEVVPVVILKEENGVIKVEAEDITGKTIALRVKREVFTSKTKAVKYFK